MYFLSSSRGLCCFSLSLSFNRRTTRTSQPQQVQIWQPCQCRRECYHCHISVVRHPCRGGGGEETVASLSPFNSLMMFFTPSVSAFCLHPSPLRHRLHWPVSLTSGRQPFCRARARSASQHGEEYRKPKIKNKKRLPAASVARSPVKTLSGDGRTSSTRRSRWLIMFDNCERRSLALIITAGKLD